MTTTRTLFKLPIIHLGDFHSRFNEVGPSDGICHDSNKEICLGGIARVSTEIQLLRKNYPDSILLNAGDYFKGTLFYDIHRGNISSYFMNKLQHDVMTIGNHDFDDGIGGLVSFLKQLNDPVVVANIDNSQEPSMQNLYTNSTIIRRNGKDIGVIGVIYSFTDLISDYTGNLKFLDEVEIINSEAKKLKAKGVNIIIVLSHSGIYKDKVIARNCPDVDIVVGGHSHIILYNGVPPSNDIIYDKYPIVVRQKNSNRKVLIVHACPFTKCLGFIETYFDEIDEVAYWKGNPIFLDESVEKDPKILEELKPWQKTVDAIGKKFIAETKVFLNSSCFCGECNLANLITDAMADTYRNETCISLLPANSIKNSIPKGNILYEDLHMAVPYNNTWDLIELQGKDLLRVIEHNIRDSISNITFYKRKLLHWSGLKVIYDLNSDTSKVVDAEIRCCDCPGETFEQLKKYKWYTIVTTDFVTSPAFPIIHKRHRNRRIGEHNELLNLIKYVKKLGTVNIQTNSRFVFL